MARSLTPAVIDAITAENVLPVIFAKMEFDTGSILVSTADRLLVFDSEIYQGVAGFGGVGQIEEAAELSANGMNLMLSGIDTNLLSIALGENYQGRPVRVWIGFLDRVTYQLIDTPALIFKGRMDTMEIKAGEKADINLICENRLADWDRPRVLRYNNETQKNLFPGDLGLQFAEQAAEKPIYWGRPDALV